METKEEIIDLEQIIKEAELRLKELSEDELTKVSGGFDNAVSFEKGKWIQIGQDDYKVDEVYELLELIDDRLITNMWIKIKGGLCPYKGKCLQNMSIPAKALSFCKEINRPDWAYE